MIRQIACILVGMLLLQSAASGREVVRADWGVFRKQVEARGLMSRSARIVLTSGERVGTTIVSIDDMALEVRSTDGTRSWDTGNERARIPREQVRSVRFDGRMGNKGRLTGALIGLGGGTVVGAVAVNGINHDEGYAIVIVPLIGAAIAIGGLVAGYFIGRPADKLAPEFVIER